MSERANAGGADLASIGARGRDFSCFAVHASTNRSPFSCGTYLALRFTFTRDAPASAHLNEPK